jgi:hypothetical protein
MAAKISLTQGQVATVDNEDADLAESKWYAQLAPNVLGYYAGRRGDGRTLHMSRVVLERKLGRPLSPGEHADHVNHDTLDNRRGNLRAASRSQNLMNQGKTRRNTSGYKGVFACGQRWRAGIRVSRRLMYLGSYSTRELAAWAYNLAAIEYHGSFARLNDVP